MQMVSRFQYNGRPPSASQPSTSSKNVAGSTKLRRRLSKIFHREMDEIGFGACSPDSSVTLGNSHPAICQSPRSQRCLRRFLRSGKHNRELQSRLPLLCPLFLLKKKKMILMISCSTL